MLASLPIVATRVSAVPEVVVDGETGLLVGAGDVEALARGSGALLADPERATRLGAAGLDRARTEFSVARMTERTLDVYRRRPDVTGDSHVERGPGTTAYDRGRDEQRRARRLDAPFERQHDDERKQHRRLDRSGQQPEPLAPDRGRERLRPANDKLDRRREEDDAGGVGGREIPRLEDELDQVGHEPPEERHEHDAESRRDQRVAANACEHALELDPAPSRESAR